MLSENLLTQVTVCISKVCICALTQSPLWHHASVTGKDTLPKTPEETVAKGTRANFQETVFFVTHKGGTWLAWIPDAPATGRRMPQYCIKQSKGHKLSWWCPVKREDAELFDALAHLLRPGSHDPTLCKPMTRLFFLLAAAKYIPACKSHWYKELSCLAVLMINLTRNPYISQRQDLLSVYTWLSVLSLCRLVKQAPPQASSGCQDRALVQHGLREHLGTLPHATGPLKCFQHQATS